MGELLTDPLLQWAEAMVRQWDRHDKFRDFTGDGEPTGIAVARHYLALRTREVKLRELVALVIYKANSAIYGTSVGPEIPMAAHLELIRNDLVRLESILNDKEPTNG